MSSYLFWFQLLLYFSLSLTLTWLFSRYCSKSRWLDIPNNRSAHSIPVPKGGGVIFAILFESVASWMFVEGQLPLEVYFAVLPGIAVVILGLLDDFYNLSILSRLLTQAVIILILLVQFGGLPALPLPGVTLHLGTFGYVAGLILFMWIMNLFNFMDGMDGLAAGELIFILFALCLVLGVDLHTSTGQLSLILLSLLAGFMVFNFPPASLFMGDAGSNFLAYIILVLALLTIEQGFLTLWTWGILLGVFIVDSTFTLIKRMLSGAVWYHAHSSHAYQQLMRRTGSQKRTLMILMLVNVIWLLPLAWTSCLYKEYGLLIMFISYCPLVILTTRLGAGRAQII